MKRKLSIMLMIISIMFFVSCTDSKINEVQSGPDIEGVWEGSLEVQTSKLSIVFKIEHSENVYKAFMDSPDQKVTDIPVDEVILRNDSLIMTIKMINGQFRGIVSDDIIDGTWIQGNNELPLLLKKTDSYEKLTRPQDPKAPFPYKSEDITFINSDDDIKLAGTLTYPEGNGPFPAMILISGSGPQDRNEEVLGHRPFLVLADFLTREGYAVLRYDDRGIGESEGDYASSTSYDFAGDASAAYDYLNSLAITDNSRTGIIGHSEGGMIAPIVAQNNDVDFIILLAGTGMPLEYVLYKQAEDVFRSEGYDDAFIEYQKGFQKKIYNIMKSSLKDNLIEDSLRILYNQYNESVPEGAPTLSKESIEANITALMSPWYRTVLTLDPRDYLSNIICPVLAINGENDVQVYYKDNLSEIKNALLKGGNKNVTAVSLPGINHMMQESQTGAVSEYGEIDQTISPTVIDTIISWLNKMLNE